MTLQTLILAVFKISLFLSVFAVGLKASVSDATYLFRRPRQLTLALLAINVLMPVFAVALVLIFSLEPAVEIALVMLAISPLPPLLTNKLTKVGVKESYALGLLIAVGLLAILFVPVAMEILEKFANVPLSMSVASIAALVSMTVLIPIGIGIAVHALFRERTERLVKPISQIAAISLLACLAAILVSAAPAIWALVGNGTVIALALFIVVGLAVGHLLGGPVPENRSALAVSTASRHPGIAAAIAVANYPKQKLVLAAILLYLLVDAIISPLYRYWFKRRLLRRAES
jgi:bile acid:Na+ symporter, BASS family